jgi:hypothetical protein
MLGFDRRRHLGVPTLLLAGAHDFALSARTLAAPDSIPPFDRERGSSHPVTSAGPANDTRSETLSPWRL